MERLLQYGEDLFWVQQKRYGKWTYFIRGVYPCSRVGIPVKTASLILITPGVCGHEADQESPGSQQVGELWSRREALRGVVSCDGYLQIFEMLPQHN